MMRVSRSSSGDISSSSFGVSSAEKKLAPTPRGRHRSPDPGPGVALGTLGALGGGVAPSPERVDSIKGREPDHQ